MDQSTTNHARNATILLAILTAAILSGCGALSGVLPGGEEPTVPPQPTVTPREPLPTLDLNPTEEEVAEEPTETPGFGEATATPTPEEVAEDPTPDGTPSATLDPADATPTRIGDGGGEGIGGGGAGEGEPTFTPTATEETPVTTPETPTATFTPTPSATPISTETVAPIEGPVIYTVVAGDTLGKIATLFGTTVQAIVDTNQATYPGLVSNPNAIEIGWTFIMPPDVGDGVYTVKIADVLEEIARKNNTSIEVLILLNEDRYPGLRTNPGRLEIGWILRLP